MPSISVDSRENELQMYGTAVPELLLELQSEYNIKRNQKIDIVENQIDPTYFLDKNGGSVAVSDINDRMKYIRVETSQGKRIGDVIQARSEPGSYGLVEEIGMLHGEYEITSGVNSILNGQTSPSDRRAMGALQTVNASSSMRIESMMQTLVDTMLNTYAESFVDLVYRYTSDEDFVRITENEEIVGIIGTVGNRKDIGFDIRVNFGTTIANEVRLSQLNSLLQILMQSGTAPEEIVREIIAEVMVLIKGENANTEAITQPQEEEPREPTLEEKEAAALMHGGV